MKISFVASLLWTSAYLATAPCSAMDSSICPEDQGRSIVKTSLSFDEQIENVKKFTLKRKEENLPVKMVIGATNNDRNIDTRIPGKEWIFFDISPHHPDKRPHIQADFNDLNKLSVLGKAVGSSLDQIVFDGSTFKFAMWKPEHIKTIGSMLAQEGELIFPAFSWNNTFNPLMVQFSTFEKSWNTLTLKAKASFKLDKVGPFVPDPIDIEILPEDLDSPEVEEKVQKYEPLFKIIHLDDEELARQANNLGFECCFVEDNLDGNGIELLLKPVGPYQEHSKETIANQAELRENIAYKVKSNKITKKIEEELYTPYIVSFFEPYFEMVTVDDERPYPFSMNHNDSSIIYAKKPK